MEAELDSYVFEGPILQAMVRAANAAIAYLERCRHDDGSWCDFWLPVGTSDSWVTAYAGLALHAAADCECLPTGAREASLGMASTAAAFLQMQVSGGRPGWGYNGTVPCDADSTAHAISLLARLGMPIPPASIRFLESHEIPGEGFRTYAWSNPEHQWNRPTPDVTAAALRALKDAGVWPEDRLADYRSVLAESVEKDGLWRGYWWNAPHYPTGIVLEASALITGQRPQSRAALPRGANAFELAWSIIGASSNGDGLSVADLLRLVEMREADVGWRANRILCVPPSHTRAPSSRSILHAQDARRVFTTASCLRAICVALHSVTNIAQQFEAAVSCPSRMRATAARPPERSRLGMSLDELVVQAAKSLGYEGDEVSGISDIFGALTKTSLSAPCPFPSLQLSSLSLGSPLEFSVTTRPGELPALRYAVEAGDPFRAPHARALSAIADIEDAALGNGSHVMAWNRIAPAVRSLVMIDGPQRESGEQSACPVPGGTRFWMWAGVDHPRTESGETFAALKVYVNLLNREVGQTRRRMEAAFGLANIPVSTELAGALDMLDRAGFPQEMGFAVAPGGKVACKVYYEMTGWRPDLAHALLGHIGMDVEWLTRLRPAIPGVLLESQAQKMRAGIALRVDPDDGTIRDLTVACAFPAPMVSFTEYRERVSAWILDQGGDPAGYHAHFDALVPEWAATGKPIGRMHSLFTRTVSRNAHWSTIYLRPPLDDTYAAQS